MIPDRLLRLAQPLNITAPWGRYLVTFSGARAAICGGIQVGCMVSLSLFLWGVWSGGGTGVQPFLLVYQGLTLAALLFQLLCFADAVRNHNTVMMMATAIFNYAILVFTVAQVFQVRSARNCGYDWLAGVFQYDQCGYTNTQGYADVRANVRFADACLYLCYTQLAVTALFNLAEPLLLFKVYHKYGWQIFKTQSASTTARRILRWYHTFVSVLKINVFFAVGIVVQIALAIYFSFETSDAVGTQQLSRSYLITLVLALGIPLIIVAPLSMLAGFLGAQRASRWWMALFLALATLTLGGYGLLFYFAFGSLSRPFQISRIWIATFAAVEIVLTFAMIVTGALLLRLFKHGYRDVVHRMNSGIQSVSPTHASLPRKNVLD
ncbi:hypothetical protein CXG81DRAFT_23627 [Caulochytrium protostelioides]|uniref:Uncharacterized protein n=1 Tax=Caulochytrium protostelioides TaxID=1555241 RepID=A0A4P9XF24_9FUNG|nr:hypothetical protein CXG81DRAFT_23627 [Caulochytrium protostelioides]|eukprot:RKP03791.1 hypothetical protein CXG81DRAFT_23627 [Caulochytrium protostelioides]